MEYYFTSNMRNTSQTAMLLHYIESNKIIQILKLVILAILCIPVFAKLLNRFLYHPCLSYVYVRVILKVKYWQTQHQYILTFILNGNKNSCSCSET